MSILQKAKLCDRLSRLGVLAGFAVGIVGFLPFLGLSLESSKGFLIVFFAFLSLLLWLMARSIDGIFHLPGKKTMFVYTALLLTTILSTVFSTQVKESLVGSFEISTLFFFVALVIYSFLSMVYLRERKSLLVAFYSITILGFLSTAVIVFLRLILGGGFALNVLPSLTSSIVGSWMDFGIFAACATLMTLIPLEFLPLDKHKKIFLSGVFGLSLLSCIVANVLLGWILLAGGALLVSLLVVLAKQNTEASSPHDVSVTPLGAFLAMGPIRFFSFGTFVVAFFFILTTGGIAAKLSGWMGTTYGHIRPSLVSTMSVAKDAAVEHPLFGEGMNRFDVVWYEHAPGRILATSYWTADFPTGSGYIPTQIATNGIVGAVIGISFTLLMAFLFIRKLIDFSRFQGRKRDVYFFASSYVLGLFGFLTLFFFSPGPFLALLAAFLLTFFVGQYVIGADAWRTFSILGNKKKAYSGVALIILVIFLVLLCGYITVRREAALVHQAKGTVLALGGSLDQAETHFVKAALLSPDDSIYSGLAEMAFARLRSLVADQTQAPEDIAEAFQRQFTTLEQLTLQTVVYDPRSFNNWIYVGDMYKALTPLEIRGATESAQAAYGQARTLAPGNPLPLFKLGDLALQNKDEKQARQLFDEALQEKSDYVDVLFTLALLERNAGQPERAKEWEERALIASPTNPEVYYNVGVNAYQAKEWNRAQSLFEQAVLLNRGYANAYFMLASTYEKLGRREDAAAVLDLLIAGYPDNQLLIDAKTRLLSGGSIILTDTPIPEEAIDEEAADNGEEEEPTVSETI